MQKYLAHAHLTGTRYILQFLNRFLADAPRGQVDHPAQANLILGVIDQAQKADQIAHLTPAIKALRANQAVGDSLAPEGLFQQAALGIGTVHDGEIRRVQFSLADAGLHRRRHDLRFLSVVIGHHQADFLPGFGFGKELLARAVGIPVNHRHCPIQNSLGGAVVLFQQDRARVLEIGGKALQVAVIGTPPAVDALVFIPHHIQIAVQTGQVFQDGVLGQVGVLKFVHQNVLKFVPVSIAHHRVVFQDAMRVHKHVVKVHGVIAHQHLLVTHVKAAQLFIAEVFDGVVFRPDQFVLGRADGVQHRSRAVKLLVQVGLFDDLLH